MKRIALVAILAGAALFARAQVPLTPDTFCWSWTRQGTTALADTNVWMSGVTYLLTNCAVMNGTNAVDLTGCGVLFRVGDSVTNVAFHGVVQSPATGGLVSCYFTIPPTTKYKSQTSVNIAGIQLAITNGPLTVIDREVKQLQYIFPLQ